MAEEYLEFGWENSKDDQCTLCLEAEDVGRVKVALILESGLDRRVEARPSELVLCRECFERLNPEVDLPPSQIECCKCGIVVSDPWKDLDGEFRCEDCGKQEINEV